jgi:hypothetical protein
MLEGQEQLPFSNPKIVVHKEGDVVDLTGDTQHNYDFFQKGPGYNALNM